MIAVLVGIVALFGSIPLALATSFVFFSDDIFRAEFRPGSLPDEPPKDSDSPPRARPGVSPPERRLQREAVARMPLAAYAARPLWRRARFLAASCFVLAVLVMISSVGVFRGREAARRRLTWCCIALGLFLAWGVADAHHRMSSFRSDALRDWAISLADLHESIGARQSNLANDWDDVSPAVDIRRAALVLFALLSIPWQLAALVLAFMFPSHRTIAADQ